jgi:hypothetical protein
MPPDGNPHPMPGNLQPNLNMFVGPQYPEIGWDAVEEQPEVPMEEPIQANENHMVENQQSMVMDLSDNSTGSVNMEGALQGPGNFNVLQVGRVELRPILPPHMMWDKLMLTYLPELYAKTIPLSMQMSSFRYVKRTWEMAFQIGSPLASGSASDKRIFLTVKPRAAPGDFCFKAQGMFLTNVSEEQAGQDKELQDISSGVSVPSTEASSPDAAKSVSTFCLGSSSVPPAVKVTVWKRRTVALIDPAFQRVTRSVSSGKGFRATPIKDLQPRPKKRTRKVESSSVVAASVCRNSEGSQSSGKKTGETGVMVSIPVMQHIGELLQMDPEDLTVAKLTAKPRDGDASPSKSDD